jgi:hypothetical protein
MQNKFYLLLTFAAFSVCLQAQPFQDTLLLSEDFSDTTGFTDLTRLLIWGDHTEVESGFQYDSIEDSRGLVYQAIHMTPKAMEYAGYQPNTIRASQAVDFRFPTPISREADTLIVEFDALWDVLNSNGWGESGRIVATLLHDYPENGISFGAIDDLSAEAPFARPAYNMRLRNTEDTGAFQSGGLMLYGGGEDSEGEIEQAFGYWLPGFSSEAGGGTPGQGAPYPLSPTQKNEGVTLASTTHWKHYTWVIAPDRLSFYQRDALTTETENELVIFMETPRSDQFEGLIVDQLNEAHGTDINEPPALYHWFEQMEALRLYFRGVDQAYLANLEVHHRFEGEPVAIHTPDQSLHLQVFPNPATSVLYVKQIRPGAAAVPLQLFNNFGQVAWQGQLQQAVQRVDIGHLPPGIYYLRAGYEPQQIQKIIIQ